MKRHLLNLMTALSGLLCLAACVLWARSYWRGDVAGFAGGPPPPAVSSEWFVRSNYGVLYFARNQSFGQGWGHEPRPLHWMSHEPDRVFSQTVVQQRSPRFACGPFSLGGMDRPTMSHVGFTVPHWFFAALAAVLPVLWIRQFWRRRSPPAGTCTRCGYDLRATPCRCPECGATVSGAVAGIDTV
jgi:hypothetical protein